MKYTPQELIFLANLNPTTFDALKEIAGKTKPKDLESYISNLSKQGTIQISPFLKRNTGGFDDYFKDKLKGLLSSADIASQQNYTHGMDPNTWFSNNFKKALPAVLHARYNVPKEFLTGEKPLPTGPQFEKIRQDALSKKDTDQDWSTNPPTKSYLNRIAGIPASRSDGIELPDTTFNPEQMTTFGSKIEKDRQDFGKSLESFRKHWPVVPPLTPDGTPDIEALSTGKNASYMEEAMERASQLDIPVEEFFPPREVMELVLPTQVAPPEAASRRTGRFAAPAAHNFGPSGAGRPSTAMDAASQAFGVTPSLPSGIAKVPANMLPTIEAFQSKVQNAIQSGIPITPDVFEEGAIVPPEFFKEINQIKAFSRKLGIDPTVFVPEQGRQVRFEGISPESFSQQGNRVQGPLAKEYYRPEQQPEAPSITKTRPAPKLTPPVAGTEGQFTGQPLFVSQAVEDVVNRALEYSRQGHEPYPGERVAPLNPSQEEASNLIRKHIADNPFKKQYERGASLTEDATKGSILEELAPHLEAGLQPSTVNIKQYLNPHQEHVIENMYKQAGKHFDRHILRPLEGRLIAKGMSNSSIRPKLISEALDDFMRSMREEDAKLRSIGYESALKQASSDRERALHTGQLHEQARRGERLTKLEAGKQIHRQGLEQEAQKLSHADILRMLGTEQRNVKQQELDQARAAFDEEKIDQAKKIAFAHEMARGLPFNVSNIKTSTEVKPQPVVPSSFTTAGGLMQGLGGMLAGQKMAEGGQIKNRYQPSPEEQEYLNQMEHSAQEIPKGGSSPMWDFISRMGFETAASRDPNWSTRLGSAAKEALPDYHRSRDAQESRNTAALNLRNKMLETRMMLSHEYEKKAQEKEELAFKNEMMERTIGQKGEKLKQQEEENQRKKERHALEMKMMPQELALKAKVANAKYEKLMKQMKPKEGFDPYENAPTEAARTQAYAQDLGLQKELPEDIKNFNALVETLNTLKNNEPLGRIGSWAPTSLFPGYAKREDLIEKASVDLSARIMKSFGNKAAGKGMLELLKKGVPSYSMNKEAYDEILQKYFKEAEQMRQNLLREENRLKKHNFDIEGIEVPRNPISFGEENLREKINRELARRKQMTLKSRA